MSTFTTPSGNTIVLSSGDQDVASGTFSLQIIMADADAEFGDSYDIELLDIGEIEVDYNYIEGVGDINDVKINVPSMKFEFRDICSNSNNVSDTALVTNMISRLDGSDLIVAKITFSGRSDYYYTTRQQTSFDYKTRVVTMDVLHPVRYGAVPPGVTWNNSLFSSNVVSLDIVQNDVIFPKTLITKYMRSLSQSDVFVYNSDVYVQDDTTSFSDLDETILFSTDYTQMPELDTFADATTSVKALSLSESAIIGNILGYSFYMPRYETSTAYRVFVTEDDFEDLKVDYAYKNIRYFSLDVGFGNLTSSLTVSNQLISSLGQRDVSIDFNPLRTVDTVVGAVYDAGNTIFNQNSVSIPTSGVKTSITNGFKDIMRIPRSLGSVDVGSVITGKLFGVNTLKPYEYFYVNSTTIHPLVNERRFRPSSLKYNLKEDTIEFEAYEF